MDYIEPADFAGEIRARDITGAGLRLRLNLPLTRREVKVPAGVI